MICTECGLGGQRDVCARCGCTIADDSATSLMLKNSLKSAWIISLSLWGVFVLLVVALDETGYMGGGYLTEGGASVLLAGCVFGGLVQTFILWSMAGKGHPYAGALWGFLAGSGVTVIWWVLPWMFAIR